MIQNINARMHKNDTLYILGDIAHRITIEEANSLICLNLNSKKEIFICYYFSNTIEISKEKKG